MSTAAVNRNFIANIKLKGLGKFTALFFLCCLADYLFYGEAFGVSVPIFFLLANGVSLLTTKRNISKRQIIIASSATFLSIAPAVNEVNWLTVSIALLGTLWVSVFLRRDITVNIEQSLYSVITQLLRLPINLFVFIPHLKKGFALRKVSYQNPTQWKRWFLPLSLTAIFLTLFTFANPIIAEWVRKIEFGFILDFISIQKLVFWIVAASVSWAYIHPYIKKYRQKTKTKTTRPSRLKTWLDENNIGLTLVLFNVLFGVQTVLDFIYIWNGIKLPEGVTYSEYVHQGTYILILTSLLAALFILYATHENRNYHANPFVKLMLLLWAAQNVLLVLSTMSRMEIYILDYSLTELRIWASIWMLLVIIGLILIFLRLLMNKTNDWLIKGNIISLISIMYVMGFANLPYLIADYNLNIAKPRLVEIDTLYISKLGAETIPAIDTYIKGLSRKEQFEYRNQKLRNIRKLHVNHLDHNTQGWRQWSYRHYRLQNYLKLAEINFK